MKATNRQRTKCSTGCWTCRSRRVKCDETSPSCQRCRQFGVQCEGYGIRLNWVRCHITPNSDDITHHYHHDDDRGDGDDDQAQGPRASRRSLKYLGVSLVPRLSSPELDCTLRQIDEWCPGESSGLDQGGFSVFPVDLAGRQVLSELGTSSPVPSDDHPELMPTEAIDQTDELWSESASLPAISGVGRGSELDICLDAAPVAQALLRLGRECDHVQQSEPTVVGASQAPLHQRYGYHQPRHLDILPMPASQKRLIHHWVTFTSRKLALLDEPHNPCRTMMLPMALKGLMSNSEDSNADVATFHALCAAAAFNLFELGGRTNEQDRVLALKHDQEAIRHLRDNLTRADEHRDQSFAMAIMACIAVDAISGTTQRWRTHVSGGLAYLAKLRSRGMDEVVLSAFQRHMVSMAVLCDFSVPNDLKSFLNDDGFGEGIEFTFPYYGVSRSFLRAHDSMTMFAAAVAASGTKTPTLEKELDAFELQLYLDFPGLPFPDTASPTKSQGVILHHVAKAFYYAGLVFFQRSIRRGPLDAVQALVELGICELESVERLGKAELGCMMLWPVLVLGAECGSLNVQQRMHAWFRNQRKLGFRNLVVLEELIDAVWRARTDTAANGSSIDWQDVIVLAQFDVFRL